jgi:hypothetical protein
VPGKMLLPRVTRRGVPDAAALLAASTNGIHMLRRRLSIGLLALFAASAADAQQPGGGPGGPPQQAGSDANHAASAPVARAVRVEGRISVDGRLDDAAWAQAPVITDFTQVTPNEGQPSTERTEVRIVYDDDAVYVGAMLYDRGPVSTRLVRRDAFAPDSDWFTVSFDTYHDHLTGSVFGVNPSGVRRDQTGVIFGGGGGGGGGPGGGGGGGGPGGGGGGSEWNPVWQIATAVTDSGWVAEMRIPFSQLRFGRADVQTWGIQLERTIARNAEETMFAFTPRTQRGGPSRWGHLVGLEGIEASNPLEIVPYASSRADFRRVPRNAAVDFENPFRTGRDLTWGLGADLQYRVSSNFTLNATVNPDFGQVEVDPAVINLSAFETRLQENRPFFIEGAEIFRFGSGGGGGGAGQLLYTRRVGRNPSLSAPAEAAYVDMPETARIIGAAKLTGRTENGWSIGLLEAVTNKEWAPFVDRDNLQRQALVEPLANYFTARVKRDFNAGRSSLGGLVTSVHRRLEGETMEARLRDAAYTGGVDFRHEWANRTWSLTGQISPSYISGSAQAITSAQNSSARYFARPDADHLEVDPTATSLAGYAGNVSVGKRAGTWTGNVILSTTSPAYEINDLGFQTTADRIALDTNLNYRQTRPGTLFRTWGMGTGPDLTWNYGGDLIEAGMNVFFNAQLLNYWSGLLFVGHQLSVLNDRLTRGGPLARDPAGSMVGFNVNSDPRRAYTVGGGFNGGRDASGAWSARAAFNVGLKPAGNWDVRVGPSLSRSHTTAQYVQGVNDPLATHTFGRRYVFAELDQTTVSLETRVNVNFTPNVSFELYAQPLISSGDFGTLMELERPRTFDFVRYGIDGGSTISQPDAQGRYTIDPDGPGPAPSFRVANRDFNTRSLRGNAVFRWEWRPGSTLFLVWQQSRSETLNALGTDASFQRVGHFDISRDARDLFGLQPDNLFMVKITYWLNP